MQFKLGSELELIAKRNRFGGLDSLVEHMIDAGFATNSRHSRAVNKYSKWSVHSDASISNSAGHFPAEIVSPCLPMVEYFREYKRMIEFLGEDIRTNSSTGFHHGVSLVSDLDNATLNKKQLLIAWLWAKTYETEELARWGRTDNGYCRPAAPNFAPENLVWGLSGLNTTAAIVEALRKYPYRFGKYSSINFSKLTDYNENNYLEVRLMGGRDYHKRMGDVLTTLSRVMETIDHAFTNHRLEEMVEDVARNGSPIVRQRLVEALA